MSKSLGNVIEPFALVDDYGTDALRYFSRDIFIPLKTVTSPWSDLKMLYNADLANGIGNLAARIMKLGRRP
jgi:methionyl-tRNA synthetase